MPKYKINYGLGGSFGVTEEIMEFPDEETANKEAYELAKQDYQSYEGYHGVRDVQDILEEEECTEEEAYVIYEEEVENMIEYWVELIEE